MTRRTLEEMAADAAAPSGRPIECPECGCNDFRTYGTPRRHIRYKSCRNCGHKVVTSTSERILRDVDSRSELRVHAG